jgi:cell division protease FtsH
LVFAVSLFGSRGDVGATQMQYSDFRAKVAEDWCRCAIGEQRISGHFKNGEAFTTVPVPNDVTLQPLLQQHNVKYAGKAPDDEHNLLLYILAQALPFLLILGVAFSRCVRCRRAAAAAPWALARARPSC